MRRVTLWASAGLLAAVGALAAPAAAVASFEQPSSSDTRQQFSPPPAPGNPQRQDTPNDPNYDQAEPDTQQPPANQSTNLFDERFDLFGFPSSKSAASAFYKDSQQGHSALNPQVSGYNAAGAWKLTRGRPDVTVAILDTGIKWDNLGLRTKIHLNKGELPLPRHPNGTDCAAYDCNGDGVFNVEDYAGDPRVSLSYPGRLGPPGLVTGQDLIRAFSDGVDGDGNGYVDDIAGWNFFDNTNDPTDRSSYFAASNHGSGRAGDAAERGNDGQGSIGVCPNCQVMPIRVWDTFVSDGNTFGLGMIYAADNGARVIEGADGSLYHSAFAERASQYAYDKGVLQTYSGDDLNTGNHNYPANYSHAMLIEGTVPDTVGLGQNLPAFPGQTPPQLQAIVGAIRTAFLAAGGGSAVPVQSYFRGANTTQYGGKSSISMEGATGSINTGRAAGGAGLVISAARQNGITLTPDETREILEQTAERVTTPNTAGTGVADPGASSSQPLDQQWTTHFGWGRANLGDAVSVAANAARIPPEAAINSPDWYAPLTGRTLAITGLASNRRAPGPGSFHWKLMWGAGLAPTAWSTVGQGEASGTKTSGFGTIDLNAVRNAVNSTTPPLDPGGPVFSPTSPNPYRHQFTVQLEVTDTSTGSTRLMGVDRRVFTAISGPTLRSGYPKRLGTGGEAPIRYADLNGDNVPELIVPTEDGLIHAYRPNGSELPGWPVRTRYQSAVSGHENAPGVASAIAAGDPPREPPRGALIADLDGTGKPSVIDTAGTHLYVWNADGTLRTGFPVQSNMSFCGPSLEHQPDSHPKCGFLSSPALAHLEGRAKPPDIVIPSLDGHLYAFRRDGTAVPNFPVALVDPSMPAAQRVTAESINQPAIGDLNGDGVDDVVVATNETYGASQGSDVSFAGALGGAGQSTRVYAVNGATGKFLPGWPIHIAGILQSTLPLIGPGNDPAMFRDQSGRQLVVASATSGSLATYDASGTQVKAMRQEAYSPGSNATDRTPALNLFESAAIGRILPAPAPPSIVKYEVSLGQVTNLLLVGQNQPYNHLIGAWSSASGAPEPTWPTITDDYQFLSSSTIAKVDAGSAANQVLAGTGLGLLHAYDGLSAQDAPGFPKETGGWLFAPAAISSDRRIADITREGYLFEWNLAANAPRCQAEWPSFRHDQQGSGNYSHDGTPPSAAKDLALARPVAGRYRLSFTSPGDDGSCGTATRYLVRVDGRRVDLGLGAPVPGGSKVAAYVRLPRGAKTVTLQAQDEAGNLGYPIDVAVPSARGGGAKACLKGPLGLRARARTLGPVRIGARAASLHRLRVRRRPHGIVIACVSRSRRPLVLALARGRVVLAGTRGAVRGSPRPGQRIRIRTLRRVRGVVPGLYRRRNVYLIVWRGRVRTVFLASIRHHKDLRLALRRSGL